MYLQETIFGVKMPPERCCVCRFQGKGHTYPTDDLSDQISGCFGVELNDLLAMTMLIARENVFIMDKRSSVVKGKSWSDLSVNSLALQ